MRISKKLTTTLLTVAGLFGVALTDQQVALYALVAGAAVSVGYILAQAYVDAVGAANTTVDEIMAAVRQLLDEDDDEPAG